MPNWLLPLLSVLLYQAASPLPFLLMLASQGGKACGQFVLQCFQQC